MARLKKESIQGVERSYECEVFVSPENGVFNVFLPVEILAAVTEADWEKKLVAKARRTRNGEMEYVIAGASLPEVLTKARKAFATLETRKHVTRRVIALKVEEDTSLEGTRYGEGYENSVIVGMTVHYNVYEEVRVGKDSKPIYYWVDGEGQVDRVHRRYPDGRDTVIEWTAERQRWLQDFAHVFHDFVKKFKAMADDEKKLLPFMESNSVQLRLGSGDQKKGEGR